MESRTSATTGGIGSWATRRAFLSGDRIALIDGDRRITYTEFDRRTDQLARALRDFGVRQGDRVAALLVNSAAFLETMFATAKLGAVFVPINFRLAAPEVSYLLADSGADVFVWSGQLSALARAALAGEGVRVRARVVVGGEPADGEADFEQVLASGEPRALGINVAGSDLCCLMYTSGTTGRPKGAMLTHDNLLWNVINVLTVGRGLRETDRTVTVAPLFHMGGLGVHTLPLIYVGGTNAILSAFDPETDARRDGAGARHRAVPGAGDVGRADDGPRLRVLRPVGARAGRHRWGTVSAAGARVLPRQGCAVPGGLRHDRDRSGGFDRSTPITSRRSQARLGGPVFHVETRIVDENDRDVPTGEVGELVVRGPNVFAGYWGLPEATAEAFRGGWFHTGDLGRMDAEGFITLVDRKKDMIITGGENVYPIEVEQVLYRHPAIREVAVVGVPHAKWGETPIAVVALEDGAQVTGDDLIGYARERLAHFKCPTRVEYVPELPRNATGKVLKTTLRKEYGGEETSVQR